MLANHNIATVIGSWTNIQKTAGGIMVSGNFSETQYAQQQRQLMIEKHIVTLRLAFPSLR